MRTIGNNLHQRTSAIIDSQTFKKDSVTVKISDTIDKIWRKPCFFTSTQKIFAWGISLFLQKDRFSTGQSKTITFYNLFWLLSIIKLQNNTSSVQIWR